MATKKNSFVRKTKAGNGRRPPSNFAIPAGFEASKAPCEYFSSTPSRPPRAFRASDLGATSYRPGGGTSASSCWSCF